MTNISIHVNTNSLLFLVSLNNFIISIIIFYFFCILSVCMVIYCSSIKSPVEET